MKSREWALLVSGLAGFAAVFLVKRWGRIKPTLMHERDQMASSDAADALGKSRWQLVLWFARNWLLERLALTLPVPTWRVACHRLRGINIGKNVYIGYDVVFDRIYPHLITIDDCVEIGERCIIAAHSQSHSNDFQKKVEAVHIKRGAWIMPAAIVAPGVTIGERAVIGAGAMVRRDIPADSLVASVPSKVIPIPRNWRTRGFG